MRNYLEHVDDLAEAILVAACYVTDKDGKLTAYQIPIDIAKQIAELLEFAGWKKNEIL